MNYFLYVKSQFTTFPNHPCCVSRKHECEYKWFKRYGKHQLLVNEFIKTNQAILEAHPNAFFSVNVVARKPEKNQPETNPYLQKFLKQIDWKPQLLAVFAGRIDYPSLGFIDKHMLRLIMWITKGPTDPTLTVEFTDWSKVEEFGRKLTEL